MRLARIEFTRRENGSHHFRGHTIEAVKVGNGVGVLVTFNTSQIDRDFQRTLYRDEVGLWAPSQDEMNRLQLMIDRSDYLTAELLKVKGWTSGPRPFKIEEFV